MDTSDYNLDIIKPLVDTKYGDYGGYIQIDGNDFGIHELCEDHGIDRDKYFVIGFSCEEKNAIIGIGQRDSIDCSALVLETSIYGNSFDEIQKTLSTNEGKAKVKRIYFSIKPEVLTKYIKRFDFMVTTKLTKHISEIDIEDVT